VDPPAILWLLETLKTAALVTGCLAAGAGTALYAVGKLAERRRR
jgi:hypothetical protein